LAMGFTELISENPDRMGTENAAAQNL